MKTVFKVIIGMLSPLVLWAFTLLLYDTMPRPYEFGPLFASFMLWVVSFAGVIFGNLALWDFV